MKHLKLFGFLLLLSAIVFTSFSCTSTAATSATPTARTAVVTKGTLTNAITATGNLAYSTTQDLAFEIPGYVDKVDVSVGDTVKKGQELANVDTSTYQDTLNSLNKALYNAQSALTSRQRAVTSKQSALAAAQRTVISSQLALSQAQINIDSANYNLANIAQVKSAQDWVDAAQLNLDVAIANQLNDSTWTKYIPDLKTELDSAKANLKAVENQTATSLTTSAALAIKQANLTVALKQQAFADAEQAITDAQTAVVNAQLDIDQAQLDLIQAQQDVATAQSNLDTGKSKSPTIYAPFDGYITSVPVKGGDQVYKGTIAMTIADPTQFKADVLVAESDIASVKLDGDSTVALDALSNLTFPAKVTFIAPTATITSGVVNYKVTVTLTSIKPISPRQTLQGSSSAAGQTSFPPPSGATPPAGFSRPSSVADNGAANSGAAPNISLKQGLSATVSIINQQKGNVLYIPSRAITRKGATQTVNVLNGTAVESRTVTTGMTDGTNTEILTGLAEGEKVTYTTTTTASSTTNRTGDFPGVGRIGG